MFKNEKCIKIMFIGYFIITVLLFYSFSKIKSVEKMTNTESIHNAVKLIYDLDMVPINRLSKLVKELEDGTASEIKGNIKITGNLKNFPSGSIIAWSKNNIPTGWVLCDGDNNTPDLRGKMILGSGTKNIGISGGSETHKLNEKELPSHNHKISYKYLNKVSTSSVTPNVSSCMSCGSRNGFGSVSSNKDTSNPQPKNVGGSQSHNNMPPFYVLKWIMKL